MPADKPLSPAQVRRLAESARDAGIELAARRKDWYVRRDTLRFLDAMMASPIRTASMDDAVGGLATTFADGGKWRGSIPKALDREGLIESAGVRRSDRLARHRGYVGEWRAVDLGGINCKRDELRRWLAENPEPVEPVAESLFAGLAGEGRADHV